jgi:predicted kinase
MSKPFLAIITGPMGAGKTTIAKIVHEKMPGVALVGRDKIKWFVSHFNRTPEENRVAREVLMAMIREYLKQGVSVMTDEGLMQPGAIDPFIAVATESQVPFFVFQIEAPQEVLLERLAQRPVPAVAKEPMSQERILTNIENYFTNKYASPTAVFDSAQTTSEDIASQIMGFLAPTTVQ